MLKLTVAAIGILAATGPVSADPSLALISQVRGEVTLSPGTGSARSRPARPLQPLAAGSTLRLGRNAEAVVICASDRAVRLTAGEWRAGAEGCAAGRLLAPGTFARLMPPAGRVRAFHGSLLEEAPSRSDGTIGKLPELLSPRAPQRNVVLLAMPTPAVTWLEVSGALFYELVLERSGKEHPVRLAAKAAACRKESRSAPVRACTADWPWPHLEAGEEVKLRLWASTADPDWPIREADASRLRLADAGARRAVEQRLSALAASDLPAATHELLRATVYAEATFYNEAAAALAASLEARPQAAVAVRLADLYLGLGLQRGALNEYSRAKQLLPPRTGELDVRAAVELGFGRISARRQDAQGAARHLDQAANLYRRLGWAAEAEAAAAEAALARRGLP